MRTEGNYVGGIDEYARRLAGGFEQALDAGTAACPVCAFEIEKGAQVGSPTFPATREEIKSSLGVMYCKHHLRKAGVITEQSETIALIKNLLMPAFNGASDVQLARLSGGRESSVPSHEFVRAGRCARKALSEGFVLVFRAECTIAQLADLAYLSESKVKRVLSKGLTKAALEGIPVLLALLESQRYVGDPAVVEGMRRIDELIADALMEHSILRQAGILRTRVYAAGLNKPTLTG